MVAVAGDGGPGDSHLHTPALILIVRGVQGTAQVYGVFQPGDVPVMQGVVAAAVGLRQEEIPHGVEGVHLYLDVVFRVAVRVNEYLEIRVAEDDGIMLREGCPQVFLLHVGVHVKVGVIPQHAYLCAVGDGGALNIAQGAERHGLLPRGLIRLAVYLQGGFRALAYVGGWLQCHSCSLYAQRHADACQ